MHLFAIKPSTAHKVCELHGVSGMQGHSLINVNNEKVISKSHLPSRLSFSTSWADASCPPSQRAVQSWNSKKNRAYSLHGLPRLRQNEQAPDHMCTKAWSALWANLLKHTITEKLQCTLACTFLAADTLPNPNTRCIPQINRNCCIV